MGQRPRIYYSESQKALMWERWRKGEPLHQIAQLLTGTTRRSNASSLSRVGYVRPNGADRHLH